MNFALRAGVRRGMRYFLLAAAVASALFFGKRYFFPSEADRIRSLLSNIIERAQVSATSSPILRAYDVRAAGRYLAEQIELSVETAEGKVQKVLTRLELEQKAIGAKTSFKTLEILMLPPSVRISGNEATADTEINVLGSLPDTEGQFYERHRVTFGLRKVGNGWKLEKIAATDLRSPPPDP